MGRNLVIVAVIMAAMLAPRAGAFAQAAAAQTGNLAGAVSSAGQPIGGAAVQVSGPTTASAVSAPNGSFAFSGLPAGIYRIAITKAGFVSTESDASVIAGTTTNANVQLQTASLSSIQTIGRVVKSSARNAINTTTASSANVAAQEFTDQGQLGLNRTLNEIPGLTVGMGSGNDNSGLTFNSASPLSAGVPSLRGSLPYETASLIDGHPITLGLSGTFNPAFLSPYILQGVEVVKGPGAFPTNINYAIGGTVNFRTLEPTNAPRQSFDLGVDQFGGQYVNARATGTILNGKLSYAFDYAAEGTRGPARGNPQLLSFYGGSNFLINGQPLCLNPAATCVLGFQFPPSSVIGNVFFTTSLMACCPNIGYDSEGRNQLGKLRYNFSSNTSLTVAYLGGFRFGDGSGGYGYTLPLIALEPASGYAGSLPAGTIAPYDTQQDDYAFNNANLYEAELRTTIGPVSLNGRYYAADYRSGKTDTTPTTWNTLLYGSAPLNNDISPTIFNGVPVSLTSTTGTAFSGNGGEFSSDHLAGYTFQASLPVGNSTLRFSYDASKTRSSAENTGSQPSPLVPTGSGQSYQTVSLLGQVQLAPTFQATLEDYATTYTDHYSQDFGATFQDSTHSYNAPRLAFLWRPASNTAIRAASGFSLAPPFLTLLTNTKLQSISTSAYGITANSGDVRPETSFGWDLGADQRVARDTVVSLDVYQTLLQNQFLQTTYLGPSTYTCTGEGYVCPAGPGVYPIYITKTQNLGHSIYKGVEFAVRRDPALGIGYKLQGSLLRAYPYDLPPGFYDTAQGANTTNLGVLPYVNFQADGYSYNALSFSRVPYAQGYAELNWHGRNGAQALLGATYFGPNNAFNEPPFGLVNASYRQPITKNISLMLAVANLTNAYNQLSGNYVGGLQTPLVNGQTGWTIQHTLGPSTASLTLHVDL